MSFSFQPRTVYLKTAQGRAEVVARAQGLTMLQRRLLILSDGVLTAGQLQTMLGMPIDVMLQHLLNLGFLQPKGSVAVNLQAPASTPVPAKLAVRSVAAPLMPVAPMVLADNDEAYEDDLNSDFSEELSIDSMSHFERDSSQLLQTSELNQADPSSTLQRAITTRGIALGKAYLINLASRLLDARDAHLVRNISKIKTEGDLYHQFELLIDTIGTRLGSTAINEILEQFDEQINQA